MIIDFHTHCFPDRIAQRAIEKLKFVSGNLEPFYDGTVSGLKDTMKKEGIATSVVLNIATNPHQQKNVNDFAASINNKKDIFAFGSVHPDSPDALYELERIKDMGLLGVKLHPDYQGFEIDDEKMIPIYKKISSLGLITSFHAGQDYGYPPPYKAMPKAFLKALGHFDTPVIAAHWGGAGAGDDVLKYLCGENVYFDLSLGYFMMPKYYGLTILEKHPTDKLLFGTDSPWHTPSQELGFLSSLSLSDGEYEKITSKNAKKLLGIDE